MKMQFTIEEAGPIHVLIERNWFTGRFTCTANGKIHTIKNPMDPGTHFNFTLKRTYAVDVSEQHRIVIEHTRPLFFAGFRPQQYAVTVNGEVVAEYRGY